MFLNTINTVNNYVSEKFLRNYKKTTKSSQWHFTNISTVYKITIKLFQLSSLLSSYFKIVEDNLSQQFILLLKLKC